MTSKYFILVNKDKKYLKSDGSLTGEKDKAATYYYKTDDKSVIYQDYEGIWKPSVPFYREQVCNGNCSGKGYCKGGICVCNEGYDGNNCENKKSSSSSIGLIIGIIITVIILGIIAFFIYKKRTDTGYVKFTVSNIKGDYTGQGSDKIQNKKSKKEKKREIVGKRWEKKDFNTEDLQVLKKIEGKKVTSGRLKYENEKNRAIIYLDKVKKNLGDANMFLPSTSYSSF
jgi:hypothetical protein